MREYTTGILEIDYLTGDFARTLEILPGNVI